MYYFGKKTLNVAHFSKTYLQTPKSHSQFSSICTSKLHPLPKGSMSLKSVNATKSQQFERILGEVTGMKQWQTF